MKLFSKLFSNNKSKFVKAPQRSSRDFTISEKYCFLRAEHELCEYIIKVLKKNKIQLQDDMLSKLCLPEYSYTFDQLLAIAINNNEYDKAILAKIESNYPEIKNFFNLNKDKMHCNPFQGSEPEVSQEETTNKENIIYVQFWR